MDAAPGLPSIPEDSAPALSQGIPTPISRPKRRQRRRMASSSRLVLPAACFWLLAPSFGAGLGRSTQRPVCPQGCRKLQGALPTSQVSRLPGAELLGHGYSCNRGILYHGMTGCSHVGCLMLPAPQSCLPWARCVPLKVACSLHGPCAGMRGRQQSGAAARRRRRCVGAAAKKERRCACSMRRRGLRQSSAVWRRSSN